MATQPRAGLGVPRWFTTLPTFMALAASPRLFPTAISPLIRCVCRGLAVTLSRSLPLAPIARLAAGDLGLDVSEAEGERELPTDRCCARCHWSVGGRIPGTAR